MGSHTELRMKIEKDRVVRFHYTVSEVGQEPIESSKDREPLAIMIGHGNIIPGLENAMQDREAGDSFGVDVAAADAYGERRDGLTQRVPKKHFGNQRLVPGQQVVLQITRADGQRLACVLRLRIDTPMEADCFRHGGILPFVLRSLLDSADRRA